MSVRNPFCYFVSHTGLEQVAYTVLVRVSSTALQKSGPNYVLTPCGDVWQQQTGSVLGGYPCCTHQYYYDDG